VKPTEKPILFSAPMVRAILEGRKTQTRRVAKLCDGNGTAKLLRLKAPYAARLVDGVGPVWSPYADAPEEPYPADRLTSPYGQPGGLLYVRETWGINSPTYGDTPARLLTAGHVARGCLEYRADSADDKGDHPSIQRWRPSIHMPKWASRLWLRVTDVRVERVQDISEDDAIAEGVSVPREFTGVDMDNQPIENPAAKDWHPVDAFADLWDSINGDRRDSEGEPLHYSWADNPWLWVISFERTEAP
jgi:hypothetical protein